MSAEHTPQTKPDSQIVLDALTQGYHAGGHHPRCKTGHDNGCDCYARGTAEPRAALARLVEQLASAHGALREIARERFGVMPDGSTPSAYADAALNPAISPQITEYEADGDGRMYAKYDNGDILPTGTICAPFAGESGIAPEKYAEFFPASGRDS